MSTTLRVVAVSIGFAIVSTLAVAAIVVAAKRPALLVSAATTSSLADSKSAEAEARSLG